MRGSLRIANLQALNGELGEEPIFDRATYPIPHRLVEFGNILGAHIGMIAKVIHLCPTIVNNRKVNAHEAENRKSRDPQSWSGAYLKDLGLTRRLFSNVPKCRILLTTSDI
jgi:hypothetical protein